MKKIAVLILASLLALFFVSCSTGVSKDVTYLSTVFKTKGYISAYHEQGSAMLTALESDMVKAMKDDPPQASLLGYMYAENAETGELAIEVFVFEKESDAKRLVNHLKDSDVFVKGTSALRRDGRVVYMGYLDALKIAEGTG